MSFLHRFLRHHHHHDHHRGHHHDMHGHHGFGGHADGERLDFISARITRHLDLNETQGQRLSELLDCLQRQRQTIKSVDIVKDVGSLIAAERFDQSAAAQWVEQRLQAVQTATPLVLGALAAFYDSLDKEQQQALRFMLRARGGFMGRGRRGLA